MKTTDFTKKTAKPKVVESAPAEAPKKELVEFCLERAEQAYSKLLEGEGDSIAAAFAAGEQAASKSQGKGYSNPYNSQAQASLHQAFKQGFVKGKKAIDERIPNRPDEVTEGTWALPDNAYTAGQFLDLLKKPIPLSAADSALYDILGDDELFDRIADLKDATKKDNVDPRTVDIRGLVIRRMKELLKQSSGWKNQDPKVISTMKSLLKVDEALINEGLFGPSKQEKIKAEFEKRKAERKARENQSTKQHRWDDSTYDTTSKRGAMEATDKPTVSKKDWFDPTDMRSLEKQKAAYLNNLAAKKSNKKIKENASCGGTSAGAVATVTGGLGSKPSTGKPKKVGNAIKRTKPQFGKGIY